MAKTEKLFSKIIMILFLIMIVVGFTIPGFIQNTDNTAAPVDQRLCTTDADCYLLCNDVPEAVLCYKNLCSKNTCEEYNYYPLTINPLTFSLTVIVDGKSINLTERSSSQDLFVNFIDDHIIIFSPGLSLNNVLDKAGIILEGCLIIDKMSYCSDDHSTLEMVVNSEKSLQYGSYLPKEGDMITVIYSSYNNTFNS